MCSWEKNIVTPKLSWLRKNSLADADSQKETSAVEKQALCRPSQVRSSRLQTSVATAFGADDDGTCKSHAISGAHDVKVGLRQSR